MIKKLLFISVLPLKFVFGCGASEGMVLEEEYGSSQDSVVTFMTMGTTSTRLMIYEGDLN